MLWWFFGSTSDQRLLGAVFGVTEGTVSNYLGHAVDTFLAVYEQIPECEIRYPTLAEMRDCVAMFKRKYPNGSELLRQVPSQWQDLR